MACYEFVTDQAAEGMRIDACIRRFLPEIPQNAVRDSFKRRDVKLEGKREKPDVRVHAGQRIQVFVVDAPLDPIEAVYEDNDILLINKRAGISVEKDEGSGVCLTDQALKHVRMKDPDAVMPIPCHRLDNQTCGLVLFAKHEQAAEILTDVFRDRTLDKRYVCLVRGMMKPPAATCRAYLIKDSEAAKVRVLDHPANGAKPIITEYETIESGPVSRLRIHLVTGRTHQIRAHMAALGHPLLGDDVYGDRAFNRANHCRRLMLCAVSLTLDTNGRLPQLDGKTFSIKEPF